MSVPSGSPGRQNGGPPIPGCGGAQAIVLYRSFWRSASMSPRLAAAMISSSPGMPVVRVSGVAVAVIVGVAVAVLVGVAIAEAVGVAVAATGVIEAVAVACGDSEVLAQA